MFFGIYNIFRFSQRLKNKNEHGYKDPGINTLDLNTISCIKWKAAVPLESCESSKQNGSGFMVTALFLHLKITNAAR